VRPLRPLARHSAAIGVVGAALRRPRLAGRRPTDSIPRSQPPDQSLCTDNRVPSTGPRTVHQSNALSEAPSEHRRQGLPDSGAERVQIGTHPTGSRIRVILPKAYRAFSRPESVPLFASTIKVLLGLVLGTRNLRLHGPMHENGIGSHSAKWSCHTTVTARSPLRRRRRRQQAAIWILGR
jgi:hypothetical protein